MKRAHISLIALLAVIFFPPAIASAQRTTGTISGTVVDRADAVLPGALVELPAQGISSSTNSQGEFAIGDLAPGEYTVKISYVGFQAFSANVAVMPGKDSKVQATLKVAASTEEITVIADRPHGEAEAINRERTSDNILNVLPSDVITSLPNANIADAVGRLPSVTLERDEGEGKYVQIRGTEPRLNNVTIDGINVPSPEAGVRQVKLDTIPADIVEAVEINKTLSANQDGDAIGGSVNLRTKTAGDLPTLTLEGIGGWTPILNTRYIGQASATVGQRFGHEKRFGALFSGSYDYNGRGIDDIEPSPNNTSIPSYGSMDLREYRYQRDRWGIAGSLDYKLKDPASGLYLHYFYSDFKDYGDKWVYSLNDGDVPNFSTSDRLPDYGILNLAIGGKHVLQKSWMAWELSVSRGRQTAAAGNPGVDFSYNPNAPTVACNFVGATNIHLPQFTPACTAPGTPFYNPGNWNLQDISTTSGITSQVNLQGAFSYARNYHIGSHFSTFEFGVKERNAHKGQDAYSPQYDQNSLANPPLGPTMTQYLSGFTNPHYYFGAYNFGPVTDFGKITRDINTLVSQGVLSLDEAATHLNSDASNYNLTERVSAAYAMNTIEFGRFRLQTGLRLEATQLNTLGFIVTNDANGNYLSTTPTPANAWYWDPLPSVQLRYRVTDDTDVRVVYGRGISRPNPYDTIPYVTIDQSTNPYTISLGNPNLKPEHANDYDMLVQHYLKPFGEIQAGIFYKQLSAPIYYTNALAVNTGPYAGYNVSQIINGSGASLIGFEAAYIQHLGFLPGALSGFGLSANYSWTGSNAGALPGRPDHPALQRQAPNTWNFSPTYDHGRFSSRLGVMYNAASIFQYQYQSGSTPDYGPGGPAGDIYLMPHTQVDAQVIFRVQRSLTVLWQGLNLTDEVFGFYNGSPWYIIQREYYKPTYSFGLRWQPRRE